eukprot:CAMPEP_0171306724 /NCGR_PEP_ID=MMETSP0816-20121228/16764_1 /TAXON_ID=420281 /ORGANISM="Proboscia inermis, Strain CCAP1064/1" /LENGTH=126 /DNA_ID=CAMNT_0011788503 /DNA_START=157 /DNA_END=534 /DNA_ORIENTATION=+
MIGGLLLGRSDSTELIRFTRRLCAIGLVMGMLFSTVLLIWKESIISFFVSAADPDYRGINQAFDSCWLLIAVMQPVNALVFVTDGLLFAHQAFGFIRNLMLGGVLLLFAPLLVLEHATVNTLLGIW